MLADAGAGSSVAWPPGKGLGESEALMQGGVEEAGAGADPVLLEGQDEQPDRRFDFM